jgi:hypothetical protein
MCLLPSLKPSAKVAPIERSFQRLDGTMCTALTGVKVSDATYLVSDLYGSGTTRVRSLTVNTLRHTSGN